MILITMIRLIPHLPSDVIAHSIQDKEKDVYKYVYKYKYKYKYKYIQIHTNFHLP